MIEICSESIDVRGGICGGTDKLGKCGVPLLFGHCPHHGCRVSPDPTAPCLVDSVATGSKSRRGPFSAPAIHPDGWVDGRSKAGRALKAARLRGQHE